MNTMVCRTTQNRCPDCQRPVSEGRCMQCLRWNEYATPDESCEACGTALYGRELTWAEDNDSPVCRRCAAAQEVN
jgi:hypothetical protein